MVKPFTLTIVPPGDLGVNVRSFGRHLGAENLSERTPGDLTWRACARPRPSWRPRGCPRPSHRSDRSISNPSSPACSSTGSPRRRLDRYRALQELLHVASRRRTNENPVGRMKPPKGREQPSKAGSASLERFVDQVDPQRIRPKYEQQRRAMHARRAHYARYSTPGGLAKPARDRTVPEPLPVLD